MDRYLDSLRAGLAFFAPAFAGRRFATLYVGGGTPSLMDPRQIEGLLRPLFRLYSFRADGERSFEFNPAGVSADKLAVLARYGFNRISMGVQSFRIAALRNENRGYQTYETVAKALALIQGQGRFVLNVDLLIGLRGDDRGSFLNTLEALLALKPDTVTIYPINPTVPYLGRYYKRQATTFQADLAARYGDAGREASAIARRSGYSWTPSMMRLTDNYWCLRREALVWRLKHVYDDIAPHPVSIFALGPTSRSRIAGGLSYFQKGDYGSGFKAGVPFWRGSVLDGLSEKRKFVFRELLDRRAVSRTRFRSLFGADLSRVFPEAVRTLRREGAILRGKTDIALVRRSPRAVFAAALHFLDPVDLEGMAEVRFSLRSGRGEWLFCIRRIAATERCLVQARGLALWVSGNTSPLVSPGVDEKVLKLVAAAFLRRAGREPVVSAARVAPRLLADLKILAARLERAVGPRRVSLRVARERGPAAQDDENVAGRNGRR